MMGRRENRIPVIKTQHLSKIFGQGEIPIKAVDDVSFEIYSTEYVVLIGPSGAGKSALLSLIGGLERPTRGQIWIRGQELGELDDQELAAYRRDKMGMVFQQFNLVSSMTAWENVSLPLLFKGIPFRNRRERAVKILRDLGLGERLNHRPIELSGGEQQRVAVARALINNPWILLIDEPTGNLGGKSSIQIMSLIRDLNRRLKRTIFLVTHNEMFLKDASRVFSIEDGRVKKNYHAQ